MLRMACVYMSTAKWFISICTNIGLNDDQLGLVNNEFYNGCYNFQGLTTNRDIYHNHVILHTPHDNSNPLSIQTQKYITYA